MLSSCICGSFHHEEDELCSSNPVSTRIKSKRNSKNPYSSRGLDKFSELLADLDGKRQKIYSQMGSHDVSLVRFMFTSANDCVPIVIKLRRKGQKSKSCELPKGKHVTTHHSTQELGEDIKSRVDTTPTPTPSVTVEETKNLQKVGQSDQKTTVKSKLSPWNRKLVNKLRRPSYYVPAALVLTLLLLTVIGRSAAAICTSLAWYLVPLLEESSDSGASNTTRNDYANTRGLNEKKMGTNVSFCHKNDHSGGSKQNSPRKVLRHQKSW